MEFIDTHTHISDEAFRGEEDEVIARAVAAGVSHMIQPDIDSSERDAMFTLCERYPETLHPMIGLYPGSVHKDWEKEINKRKISKNYYTEGEIYKIMLQSTT